MTRISLAYGQGGLDIDLPADRTLVVEPPTPGRRGSAPGGHAGNAGTGHRSAAA